MAEEAARTFDCPLHVGFHVPGIVADDINAIELFDAPIARWLSHHSSAIRDAYFSLAWQHVPELHDADVVIESGNNPGWYVPRDTQAIVRYVHSTPYAAYHRFHESGQTLAGKLYGTVLRTLYAQTVPYPDVWVANSELVARRIRRYWGVQDVEIVYPPIDVNSYGPRESADYFFTFSHLRAEKRIDEIIRAFTSLDERLVIGGDGPERDRLERMAPPNVEFVGYLDEDEKRRRLGEAQAFLFNARAEDFGIVPVEAFASGTPVIGVAEGYTQHQIEDGKNGILYARGVENIISAIRSFQQDGVDWDDEYLQNIAQQYDIDQFRTQMRSVVEKAHEQTKINPEYE
ncbi:glycosyltransferase [Halorhabdus amylolytica]|uniref:glycosyltransferase n=1 Tax=Halorhabdus amylolytica TaxID=2559573 RepID=UPI00145B7673|nr:glycosyltransferase [Halorhabdus amylolytica]